MWAGIRASEGISIVGRLWCLMMQSNVFWKVPGSRASRMLAYIMAPCITIIFFSCPCFIGCCCCCWLVVGWGAEDVDVDVDAVAWAYDVVLVVLFWFLISFDFSCTYFFLVGHLAAVVKCSPPHVRHLGKVLWHLV